MLWSVGRTLRRKETLTIFKTLPAPTKEIKQEEDDVTEHVKERAAMNERMNHLFICFFHQPSRHALLLHSLVYLNIHHAFLSTQSICLVQFQLL